MLQKETLQKFKIIEVRWISNWQFFSTLCIYLSLWPCTTRRALSSGLRVSIFSIFRAPTGRKSSDNLFCCTKWLVRIFDSQDFLVQAPRSRYNLQLIISLFSDYHFQTGVRDLLGIENLDALVPMPLDAFSFSFLISILLCKESGI